MELIKANIDINCDVGEGIGNESELFKYITSCNIACGGHSGSIKSMNEVVELALQYGVKIGAHPSYPDRENFGRKSVKMEHGELRTAIETQLYRFEQVAQRNGATFHHIKAHGALYNDLSGNETLSDIYLQCVEPFRNQAVLFAPCGSNFAVKARAMDFRVWEEAFADRRYCSDGSLASRALPGAVIEEPHAVWEQLYSIVWKKSIPTIDGGFFSLNAATCCVHGDTKGASEILAYVSSELKKIYQ
ncbi:MAG: hypothetical protein RLZZ241_1846 [Bacteroidota bacterium]